MPENSYGRVEKVSSPDYTFFLGKLAKVVNQYFVHILLHVTDNNHSWICRRRRMTEEIIIWSIAMKVWEQAEIKLVIPGSAVRLAADCASGVR